MASSEVQIANRALTKLGDKRILSLTQDDPAGRVMNSIYAPVRDAELRRARWKFALKRDQLTADVAAPLWGQTYQYQLPTDYLAMVQVGEFYVRPSSKERGPWQIEGRKLLTDMPPQLSVRYIYKCEDTSLFDPLFVECLACKMAYEACEALTQSNTKKADALTAYKFAMDEAMRADALEIPPEEYPWGSWLESREGPAATLNGPNQQFFGSSGFTVA
jgi:hypothetical protein